MRHVLGLIVVAAMSVAWSPTSEASECDSPDSDWLACEDFEDGGLGWQAWFEQSPFVGCNGCPDGQNDPARIRLANDEAHDGDWSLHMPAEESANYRGASLAWRSCEGEKRPGCTLTGYDQLYWRAWVKLAPDHEYVHHFMSIGGTQPDQYWGADGNAGCRPNGERAAGTTVDFNENRELFFYTYFPEMSCDSGGYCSGDYVQNICDGCAQKDMPCSDGPECCWGNHFTSDPPPVLERDRWVCLEMMQRLNTPGETDGEMAFWVDDELGHRETGMHWRDIPELQLNKVWVQHYIAGGDADQPNRIWWDDIIVSTSRIGCGDPPANNDPSNADPGTNSQTNNDTDPANNQSETSNNQSSPNNQSGANNETGTNSSGNDGDDSDGANSVDGEGGCGCSSANPVELAWIPFLLGFFVWARRRR